MTHIDIDRTTITGGAAGARSQAADQLALELAATRCEWCGGDTVAGSTCPKSIACPRCGAGPGASCVRPSDHRAATMHADRWRRAEQLDAAAGITYPKETQQ